MFGAILGDIIGSPYEFDMGDKTKDFPLFLDGSGFRDSRFTDDTVMTIAVAEALMNAGADADDDTIKDCIIDAMHYWGEKYPNEGYGGKFRVWLFTKNRNPYNSFGNGSAMRVSAAGWMADNLASARRLARLSAEVTHNHPEGIKGAEAVASAVFLARDNHSKDEIKDYIVSEFGYDLSRTCDEIRATYHHVESCQESVPEAITAFLEGKDFEDVIRTAVSLGGDCDTLTAIAGSIAEAFYGIPPQLKYECYQRLDPELGKVLSDYELTYQFDEGTACKYHPIYWFGKDEDGFVKLERPFADQKIMNATMDRFSTSQQAMDGWRRANLYMKAFRVWDATMFGAWMGATLACGPFVDENGEKYTLTFTTPQTADVSVYPFLEEDVAAKARENVENFYADPIAQMQWPDFILHSVAIKVTEKGEIIPVSMSEIDRAEMNLAEHGIFDFSEMNSGIIE